MVMALRKGACKSNSVNLGLPDRVSLSSVRLFDHLTPKMQLVFSALNSVGPRILVFIFVRTENPEC